VFKNKINEKALLLSEKGDLSGKLLLNRQKRMRNRIAHS